MKTLKKALGIFFVVNSVPAIYIIMKDDYVKNDKVVFVLLLLIFSLFTYAGVQLIRNKKILPEKSAEVKEIKAKKLARTQKEEELTYSSITLNSTCTYKGSRNFEDMIIANGYNVDKHIKINSKTDVYVNDTNKVFFIRQGQELKTYEFNKILDYEVTQNDEVMVKGKSMATLAGGLLFGLGGAIVGSSGKRKQVNSVSNVNFNIYLNELNNPQITLPLLTGRLKVNSYAYENLSKTVNELISVFKYIEANK